MVGNINSFKGKLLLWKTYIIRNDLTHFPNLKLVIEKYCVENTRVSHLFEHFDILLDEFNSRFIDFRQFENFLSFFINPFNNLSQKNLNSIINYFGIKSKECFELEVIEFQTDISLKAYFAGVYFWRMIDENRVPLI
ncbi:General transcription factor II-I repeat domain-containing protein 2B [Dictyocoela muelleri]|nr:General transcription factor II-I repeat domain-containing protein 2B [Dictyocoela muelleri]